MTGRARRTIFIRMSSDPGVLELTSDMLLKRFSTEILKKKKLESSNVEDAGQREMDKVGGCVSRVQKEFNRSSGEKLQSVGSCFEGTKPSLLNKNER